MEIHRNPSNNHIKFGISQEYFDEAVLENHDIHEEFMDEDTQDCLGNLEQKIVNETIEQLKIQQNDIDITCGILVSHPLTKKGKEERLRVKEFSEQFEYLDTLVKEDGTLICNNKEENQNAHECKVVVALQKIKNQFSKSKSNDERLTTACFNKMMRDEGIFTLLSFLSSTSNLIVFECTTCLLAAYDVLNSHYIMLKKKPVMNRRQLQDICQPIIPRLISLIKARSMTPDAISLMKLCIQLCSGHQSIKLIMVRKHKIFPVIIDQLMAISNMQSEGNVDRQKPDQTQKSRDLMIAQLGASSCELLAALCKFDDMTAVSSSSHEFAQELFQKLDAVDVLHKQMIVFRWLLSRHKKEEDAFLLQLTMFLVGIMDAQRVLAVNDEIVQALVAHGVLETTNEGLATYNMMIELHKKGNDIKNESKVDTLFLSLSRNIVSSAFGIYRNLSGNDEIKTTILEKSLTSIICAMRYHPNHAKIQEHGIAIMAAIALRRPENAKQLLQVEEVLRSILDAMNRFTSSKKIQRIGCLCIRNIVSRQSDETKMAIIETYNPHMEEALRRAGKILDCVDEAYAALRDLNIEVEVVRVIPSNSSDQTYIVKKGGVDMFGEASLNFKQSWEKSNDIDDKIDQIIQ